MCQWAIDDKIQHIRMLHVAKSMRFINNKQMRTQGISGLMFVLILIHVLVYINHINVHV